MLISTDRYFGKAETRHQPVWLGQVSDLKAGLTIRLHSKSKKVDIIPCVIILPHCVDLSGAARQLHRLSIPSDHYDFSNRIIDEQVNQT
jgi:hypothetical protein